MPLGCTNLAGVVRTNHVANTPLGGFGSISAIDTKVWTKKVGNVYSSYAENNIASVAFGDPSLGNLAINGIRSRSRAYHDATGYHAKTATTVATITLTPPEPAPPVVIPIPSPGQPIEIPGLLRISVGTPVQHEGDFGALARVNALKVELLASGTTLILGHSRAAITGGIITGIFGGKSYATKLTALDDNLTSGPQPLSVMPCQGTHGAIKTKSLVGADLGGQAVVGTLTSSQMAKQTDAGASGWEKASVSSINLGDGGLVVTGIVGRVSVSRHDGVVNTSTKGTTIGSIVANGQVMTFPDTDVIEIPGVLKLERNIIYKRNTGISVVALRITLLDGTGAVIDLGTAALVIKGTQL
jgi:hypothetical protein